MLLAALQGIPVHLYESADLDGADAWDRVRHAYLIKPATFFIFVTSIISSFQVFRQRLRDDPRAGRATPRTQWSIKSYLNAFRYLRMGYACATSCTYSIVIFALSLMDWAACAVTWSIGEPATRRAVRTPREAPHHERRLAAVSSETISQRR